MTAKEQLRSLVDTHTEEEAATTLIVVEEAPRRALTLCNRRVEVRNGMAANSSPGSAA